MIRARPLLTLLAFLCLPWLALAAEQTITLDLPSGTSVVSQRHAADGPILALWLTGQHGRVESEQLAAARLAGLGIETWITDWFSPLFLPLLPSSIRAVSDRDLADWLQAIHQANPGRRIVLLAAGHAAAWPLRAASAWRSRYAPGGSGSNAATEEPIVGSLLLHPVLYQELEPGSAPTYDPVAARTRLDTVLLQPMSSAGYWWRESLKSVLEAAGSQVHLEVLPGLRDGFYRRADATPREQAEGARLGDILYESLQHLLEHAKP